MRIVCIHAHPDDAEILAGGTLALLSELGHSITIISMTPGDCGSARHNAEQAAAIRREEAAEAARLIGADYHCDHEATSTLVRDACFAASVPNYATNEAEPAAPMDAISHLYFMDSLGG